MVPRTVQEIGRLAAPVQVQRVYVQSAAVWWYLKVIYSGGVYLNDGTLPLFSSELSLAGVQSHRNCGFLNSEGLSCSLP